MSIENAVIELLKAQKHDYAIYLIEKAKEEQLPKTEQLHVFGTSKAKVRGKLPFHSTDDYRQLIKTEILPNWVGGREFTSYNMMDAILEFASRNEWFFEGDKVKSGSKERWKVLASNAIKSLVMDGTIIRLSGQRNYVVPEF